MPQLHLIGYSMPFTVEQLQALRDALANRVRRERFGENEIEYRTVEERKAAIASAEAELAKTSYIPRSSR